jgi:hypothetical protein
MKSIPMEYANNEMRELKSHEISWPEPLSQSDDSADSLQNSLQSLKNFAL